MIKERLARLRQGLDERELDAILVQSQRNRYYLSGFTGTSAYLLISKEQQLLFTDSRYTEQAAEQAALYEVIQHGPGVWQTVSGHLEGIQRLGYEDNQVTVLEHQKMAAALDTVTLVEAAGLVEGLRLYKDEQEVKLIARACEIGDQAFAELLGHIGPGATERQLALELEFQMKQRGAQDLAFTTIAASGPRSSLPHGVASERVIEHGDLITFDFGCVYQGYCSDMTRTVAVGEVSEHQREIYDLVLEAQLAAVNGAQPGQSGAEIDALSRDVIEAAGHGDHFGHGLGHGVGLNVHEDPRVSPTSEDPVEAGMIFTIEPGVYIAGWGGVRIEDTCVMRADGPERLTHTSKELMII